MSEVKGMMSLKNKLRKLSGVAGQTAVNRIAYGCGLVVEGACKVNIREEPSSRDGVAHTGLIDTGFMLNATYTIGPDKNGAENARSAALARADRPFVEVPAPKNGQAIVTNGAEYFRIIHEGGSSRSGHPVLTRALAENESRIKQAAVELAKAELRKAVR